MKKKFKFQFLFVIAVIISFTAFGFDGCEQGPKKTTPQETESSRQIDKIEKIPVNASGHTVEQQNILDRIKVTSDPTKIMWMHIMSLDGKLIQRMAVRNKITSSGKSLEPTVAAGFAAGGEYRQLYYAIPTYKGFGTTEILQPDGPNIVEQKKVQED